MRENNGAISIIGERAKKRRPAEAVFQPQTCHLLRETPLLDDCNYYCTRHKRVSPVITAHRTGWGRGGIGGVGASGFCSIAHYKIYIINIYLYIHLAIILIIIYIIWYYYYYVNCYFKRLRETRLTKFHRTLHPCIKLLRNKKQWTSS